MREITINLPEVEEIKINLGKKSEVFQLKKADTALLDKCQEIIQKSKEIAKKTNADPTKTIDAIKTIISVIDQLLGKDATSKLASMINVESLPIDVALMILNAVLSEVYKNNNKKVKEEYGES